MTPRRPDPATEIRARSETDGIWRTGPIWMASDRTLARVVGRPVAAFLRVEVAGGVLLLVAALLALLWANSPWADSYEQLWTTPLSLTLGGFEMTEDLRHWVNDGLMTLFFFVVGLEIKYELVGGELRDPKAAAVPIFAAVGGMVVPATIYAAFNYGGAGSAGWGIPMATDIAFALGVLAVLGRRIPSAARVFLLTLAIVDDIGAIAVIAIFYTASVSVVWLGLAAAGIAAVVALRGIRVWAPYVYVLLGVYVWFATYQSGVHATVAGVVMGLLAPAMPLLHQDQAREYARASLPDRLDAEEIRKYRFLLNESVSAAERIGRALHPWSSYLVLPVFALANAGIDLRDRMLADAFTSPVTLGVALGLLVGKSVGVTGASWLAVRLGVGRLPTDTSWPTVFGLAIVAGVGFTVSLFVTGLAFEESSLVAGAARFGILGGSLLAACLGALVLVMADGKRRRAPSAAPEGKGDDIHPSG